MPDNGVKLTEEQREILAPLAYDYSAKGWPQTRIAERLGVHRNTVRSLIRRERHVRQSERSEDREVAIARYERVIERAWEELSRPQSNGLAVPALLNSIASAQSKVDAITGVRAPIKSESKLQQLDLSGLSDEQLQHITELGDQIERIVRQAIPANLSEN